MKKFLFAAFFLGLSLLLSAQSDLYEKHPAFPYRLTAEEQLLMHTLPVKASMNFTAAPQGPVSAVAEFQPMEGVIVAYPLGIPVNLVSQLSQITCVKVLVNNNNQMNSANSNFSQHGVNMSNVDFWIVPHDSYWTRDYGPWFVIDGNDQVGIIDFTYNRPWRPNDDAAMNAFASNLNCTLYAMPMVHTGGNYMVDGYGTAASTQLVLDENPSETATSIRQMAQEYLGVNQYFIIDDPMDDYIYHIDCWGKFLDVDKVLVAQVPTTDYRYNDYEAAAAVFANATTPWGNHYQVFRVFEPGSGWYATPYTNSLILNDHVFVPVAGSQWDDEAIEVYQQAMPGYTIVPITQVSDAVWENTDALHCRTHEIADRGMLYIKHYPLLGVQEIEEDVLLSADIRTLSGQPLVTDSVLAYYRINHGAWQNVPLASVGGSTFEASISGLNNLDTVDYYLFAKDQSGRRECHPYIGAADPHQFVVSKNQSAIANTQSQTSVLLYPNPAVDRIVIKGENLSEVKIHNSVGQLVNVYSLQDGTNTINCKDWPAAMYYLSIYTSNGEKISRKIVKVN